jgi:hypothetical protein
MEAARARITAATALAGVQAAHAFLDLAEQAPDGAVYLRGLELARSVLEQADAAAAEMASDSEWLAARDRLRDRVSALSQRLAKAA